MSEVCSGLACLHHRIIKFGKDHQDLIQPSIHQPPHPLTMSLSLKYDSLKSAEQKLSMSKTVLFAHFRYVHTTPESST